MTQTESGFEAELAALSQQQRKRRWLKRRWLPYGAVALIGMVPFLLLVNHYFHLWPAERADRLSKEEGEALERLLGRLQSVVRPDRCLHNKRWVREPWRTT